MDEDPGWPWAKRNVSGTPTGGPTKERGKRGSQPVGGLMAIRVIFSAFVTGVTLFAIVAMVAVAGMKTKPTDQSLVFPLIVLGIAAGLLLVAVKLRRPLDTSNEVALSISYRGQFIIRSAIAEGAALFAIVGFLSTGHWWMVPFVVLIGVVGFSSTAPTAGAIQRAQERLQARGCSFSLMAALNGPMTQPSD